ncbi:MAG: hypothetical protein JXN61_03430 [Sedimentisphaerales bacterium]|nr:hypothetical protein [Sedimentisphaerales bacterium]
MEKKNTIISSLLILACSLLPAGCDGGKNKAIQEAEKARDEAAKAKAALSKARAEIDELNEELYAAKNTRDELDQQLRLLRGDRGKTAIQTPPATEITQTTIEVDVDDSVVAALNAEIAQLRKLIAEQQKTIAEQEAAIEQLAESVGRAEEAAEVVEVPPMPDVPVEPNEATEPNGGL